MLTLLEIRIFKNVEKCDDKFLYISNQDETGAKIDLFLVFSWTGDEEILSRSCKKFSKLQWAYFEKFSSIFINSLGLNETFYIF